MNTDGYDTKEPTSAMASRMRTASNPAVSIQTLEKLSRDPQQLVRRVVASNLKATPEILGLLSDDDDRFVRVYALRNPSNPYPEPERSKRLAVEEQVLKPKKS